MSQIDAMFKFASLAAAKADPVVQHYMALDDSQQAQFQLNIIIPGVQVWRASQDVVGTDTDGNPTVTHTFLPGYFIFVSADHIIPELRDHPALQVAVDRDKMNARQVGMVLKTNITNTLLQDLRFQPIYAGMNPPWGAWQ
jgi:hypothetical protein